MKEIDGLISQVYKHDKGYKIVKNDVSNNVCYIYCSSNALYLKDNVEDFYEKVIVRNRYEWEHIKPVFIPQMEIYIRDIYLSWYVMGISQAVPDYDSLIAFLRNVTKGFRVRCIGASSGGFIGTMIAMELEAECISFDGQFSLINHFDHLKNNPYLRKYAHDFGTSRFELYLNSSFAQAKLVYVVSVQSEQDSIQENLIQNAQNVDFIKINTTKHGVALYPFALPNFLSYVSEEFEKYTKHTYTKIGISCRIGG